MTEERLVMDINHKRKPDMGFLRMLCDRTRRFKFWFAAFHHDELAGSLEPEL